jgi:hypothetical protein
LQNAKQRREAYQMPPSQQAVQRFP